MRLRGSPHEQRCIGCGVGPDLEVGIAAGTLKDGPDVYCIDDSEIMRELQCVSRLRWECWLLGCLGIHRTQDTVGGVAVKAASVGRFVPDLMESLERRMAVMDYVSGHTHRTQWEMSPSKLPRSEVGSWI